MHPGQRSKEKPESCNLTDALNSEQSKMRNHRNMDKKKKSSFKDSKRGGASAIQCSVGIKPGCSNAVTPDKTEGQWRVISVAVDRKGFLLLRPSPPRPAISVWLQLTAFRRSEGMTNTGGSASTAGWFWSSAVVQAEWESCACHAALSSYKPLLLVYRLSWCWSGSSLLYRGQGRCHFRWTLLYSKT